MSIFVIVITVVTAFFLVLDEVFIASKKVFRSLALFYIFILCFIWFAGPFEALSRFLGVGRSVDILIYATLFLVVRELVLSRQRFYELNKQMTLMAREIAIDGFSKSDDKKNDQ